MSKALCKNRFFKDLIAKRQISLGMTKVMVESAWRTPWRKWKDVTTGEETWEWGSGPHSRVLFNSDGVAKSVFSVVHHARGESWSR